MAGVGDLTHHAYVKTPEGWVRGAVRLEDPGTQGEQLPGEGAPGPLLTPPQGTPALWPFPGCGQSPHSSIQQVPRPSEPCGPLAD